MLAGKALIFGMCVICGVTLAGESPGSSDTTLSLREYRDEVRRMLRAQASAATTTEEVSATLLLVRISDRLGKDSRISTSPSLYALRRSVVARLRAIKRELEAEQRRDRRSHRPSSIKIDPQVLAQLNQAANRNVPAPNNQNAGNLANAAGNVAGPNDYAPQLIDLIQQTISPRSWDVNGGVSTIRYWRPGMALVVRAPGTVHDELTPLLKQLRQ